MRPETFDLSSDITLIYGPNGTGKSSFCEALEFAMLDSISEAQAKRADPRAYCNNARLRRHTPPLLMAVYEGGRIATVAADEGLYRFCFVEKNRLDDFARIAARTPSDQRQLIATLFGIDNFSEFVRGFNASLDESLVLWGSNALTLDAKRAQLATSQHTVAAFPAAMALLDAEGLTIALRYGPSLTYNQVRNWLLGTTESVGRALRTPARVRHPL